MEDELAAKQLEINKLRQESRINAMLVYKNKKDGRSDSQEMQAVLQS